jgi:hypothetical protein
MNKMGKVTMERRRIDWYYSVYAMRLHDDRLSRLQREILANDTRTTNRRTHQTPRKLLLFALALGLGFLFDHDHFRLHHRRHLVHPLRIVELGAQLLELPAEPAYPPRRRVLLLERAVARVPGVPLRVVRRVAGQPHERFGRGRPVDEGRAVRADDLLRELGHERVGQHRRPPLPDVCAPIW